MDEQQQYIPARQPDQALPEAVLLGAGDLLKRSWQIYKTRFGTLIAIMLLPIAVTVFGSLGSIFLALIGPFFGILVAIALFILIAVSSFWSGISLIYAVKGRESKIGCKEALFRGWHKIVSWGWVSFLVTFIILGGFLLFIIPGIIFLVWFSLAIYVLVGEDFKGMDVLFRSRQLTARYWWPILWRFLALGIINLVIYILSAIAAAVLNVSFLKDVTGFLITPFSLIFGFLIYDNLKQLKSGEAFEPPSRGDKIKFILIGMAGFLLISAILGIIISSFMTGDKNAAKNVAQEKARDARRAADVMQIKTALLFYYDDNNAYPVTLNELAGQPFLREIPKDPKTDLPYGYKVKFGGQDYELCVDFEEKSDECVNSGNPSF